MVAPNVPQHFYVYQHRRGSKEGPIFYVGKGCGRRAWTAFGRHPEWHDVASNFGFYVEIIANELSESDALQIEWGCIDSLGIENLVNRSQLCVGIDPSLREEWSHIFPLRPKKLRGLQPTKMSVSVQQRSGRFQLRVKHRLLPRPFFFTFETELEARNYGSQLSSLLSRGIVPAELLAVEPRRADDPLLIEIIRAYAKAAPITDSDEELLGHMLPELSGVRASSLTHQWVDGYVRKLKLERHLAPGTIRKRVGSLARVMDWHLRRATAPGQQQPANALRLLPRGYSGYSRAEATELAAGGLAIKRDQVRNLRLDAEAQVRIMAALAGVKRSDRERALQIDPAFTMLFLLIVDTGLRLREAYRMRVDQIDLGKGIIHVEGSKGHRGLIKPRHVPIKPALADALRTYCLGRIGLLFPFWDGQPGRAALKLAQARLSARFRVLFEYARVPGMVAHDIRHEATCRWIELRGPRGWVFSEIEVCRIMGWSNTNMMLRYASLRGEDLAARMV